MAENLKGAVLVPREILEAAAAEARARFPEYATNPGQGRGHSGYLQGFLECYRRERLAAVSLTEREAGDKSIRWVLPEVEMPKPWQKVECAVEEGDGSGWEHPQAGRTYHRLSCCEWNPGSDTQQAGWYAKIGRVMERMPDSCIVRLWLSVPSEDVPTFALREKLLTLFACAASPTRKGSSEWVPVGEWEKEHHKAVEVLYTVHKGWASTTAYWDGMGEFWRRESSGNKLTSEVLYVTSTPTLPALPPFPQP